MFERTWQRLLLLPLLFAFPGVAGAQSGSIRIVGNITDSATGQHIDYATVSATDQASRKVVSGAVTDSSGAFSISDLPAGVYTLSIDFIGYRPKTIDSIVLSPAQHVLDLKSISIRASSRSLNNVVVTAKAPLIENQIDKIVFNAANDVSSQGSTTLDLLRKVPQVTVDIDGNVELQGNANIRFLINGKPSSVFGSSITDALAAIPASQIQRIEAITTPGAKYDAQGTGGIINIILKENRMQGYNGSIALSAGSRMENGSVNLNMRRGNFGMNAYFSGNTTLQSRTPGSQDRTSTDTFSHTSSRMLQDGYNDFDRSGYQTGLGFDWTESKHDDINGGISFNHFGNHSIGHIDQENIGYGADGAMLSDITSLRNSESRYRTNSIDWNLDYKHKFAREGQELELQYNSSYGMPQSSYWQTQTLTGEALPYSGSEGSSPGTDRQTNISVDYTHPVSKDITIETGLKAVLQDVTSNATVSTLSTSTSTFLEDPGQSYSLDYRADIYAGYLSANMPLGHFLNLKAGARYEYTSVHIDFPNTEIPSYSILVPTLILSHKFGDRQTLKLAYTRRIERAEYDELNPFVNRSDPYNLTTGNPELKPEIGDNLELGYSRTFEHGGNLNISLIERINSQDHKRYVQYFQSYQVGDSVYHDVSVQTVQNTGTEYNSGINISGSAPSAGGLSLRGNAMLFHRYLVTNTAAGNTDIGFRLRLNLNATYQITPQFVAEAFGNYSSASQNIQGKSPQWISYTIALRKQFWDKKGSLGITATNPFNMYTRQVSTIVTDGYSMYSVREVPFQSFGLSFTWKFGKLEFGKDHEPDNNDMSGGPGGS